MRGDIDKNQQYLHEIDKNYPAGYPTFQEIKEQRDNLSVIRQETQRLQALTLDDADKETIERENHGLQTEIKQLRILIVVTKIARN